MEHDTSQDPDGSGMPEFDTSFFPAPSPYFHRYSTANLALPPDTLISDVPGEPVPFLASELEPPHVDWIVQEGSYSVFGETWPVEEHLPTLEEMGVQEMFDRSQDRKQSLQTLLRALLVTYTQLLNSILTPPPSRLHPRPSAPPPPTDSNQNQNPNEPQPSQAPSDPQRLTEHARLISINMHHLVNELRPVQARETLKLMMRDQIDRRRAKTLAIKERCQDIHKTLANLQTQIQRTAVNVSSSTTQANGATPRAELDSLGHSPLNATEASPDPETIRKQLMKLIDNL
ncbi:mediator complex subunit MED7 [Sporobolomyces koalae]|uniref:mediator complex subunit MED7 n=1 Tax=Sporobolomyces koalae TaxID=500713 RepID=UPI0031729B53